MQARACLDSGRPCYIDSKSFRMMGHGVVTTPKSHEDFATPDEAVKVWQLLPRGQVDQLVEQRLLSRLVIPKVAGHPDLAIDDLEGKRELQLTIPALF